MNSDSVFEKRIGTLLRWRKRRRLFFFLVWFLAFFLILNTLALGFQKVFHFDWDPLYLYLVLTLVSFGMALGFHLLTKKNLLADLIEIDSRLKLKDRLSTAFEYKAIRKEVSLQGEIVDGCRESPGRASQEQTLSSPFLRGLCPDPFVRLYPVRTQPL